MQLSVIFDIDGVLVDSYHAHLVVRQLSELSPERLRGLF